MRLPWLLTLLSLVPCGCGTFLSFQDPGPGKLDVSPWVRPRSIYGGVRLDARLAQMIGEEIVVDREAAGWPMRISNTGSLLAFALDLPLSLIADTVMLPRTIREAIYPTRPAEDSIKFQQATAQMHRVTGAELDALTKEPAGSQTSGRSAQE